MIIGQVLMSKTVFVEGMTDGDVYYSPWFPRGGNEGNFPCDLIRQFDLHDDMATVGEHGFTITVESKNSEESDKSSGLVTYGETGINLTGDNQTTIVTAGARLETDTEGLLELVRFKFTVRLDTAKTIGWVHFRMLNPSWLSNGA